jgi:cysteine desulfurase
VASVLEAMLPYLHEEYGNASSIHQFGQRARAAVENARAQVASLLNADPAEVVFTGGGTESDNMALIGAVYGDAARRLHVITSSMEHVAILHSCRALEKRGVSVTYLPVSSDGFVDPDDVRRALKPETVLISVMHANNEVGTVQPVAEIASLAKNAGVLFHTDAVQSTGKIPVDVRRLNVDLLSLSAHKMYGPKGVGALYMRNGVSLRPMLFGGHTEEDLRPGTENVAGIVGLGAAAVAAVGSMATEIDRLTALRDRLEKGILEAVEGTAVNGSRHQYVDGRLARVPNTTNFSFDEVDGESLVVALDLEGIACSRGAACSAPSSAPSHVLLSLGLSPERALSGVRLSLGMANTEEDVDFVLETIPRVVRQLRSMAPPRLMV